MPTFEMTEKVRRYAKFTMNDWDELPAPERCSTLLLPTTQRLCRAQPSLISTALTVRR
jgi:hypothetical protein